MLKVLHCGDLHIDARATRLGSQKIINGQNEYHLERMERIKYILDTGIKEQVDCIVIEGDIHNKINPPAQEYHDLYKLLDALPETMPVYIINGNHDENSSSGSPLLPLAGRRPNIHVMFQFTTVKINEYIFMFAPWETPFDVIKDSNDMIHGPKVLVYHAGVTGVNGMNWGEISDETGTVHLDQLVDLKCEAIMLGHHHQQTELAPNIWYAGSPECFNFGEREQSKGFLIWTLDRFTTTVKRYNTEYPKFLVVDTQIFLRAPTGFFNNCYVRVDGEVTSELRSKIIQKGKELVGCLGVKYNLKMVTKRDTSAHIPGKTSESILRNFLKKSKSFTDEQLTTFMKIDEKLGRGIE